MLVLYNNTGQFAHREPQGRTFFICAGAIRALEQLLLYMILLPVIIYIPAVDINLPTVDIYIYICIHMYIIY